MLRKVYFSIFFYIFQEKIHKTSNWILESCWVSFIKLKKFICLDYVIDWVEEEGVQEYCHESQ